MKISTKIALGFVGSVSVIAFLAATPTKPSIRLIGYKQKAVKKIVAKKNVRSGSTGRTYSGGGSSYGK
jgi:hypothetical protein